MSVSHFLFVLFSCAPISKSLVDSAEVDVDSAASIGEPVSEPTSQPENIEEPAAEPSTQPTQEPTLEPASQPTQEPSLDPAPVCDLIHGAGEPLVEINECNTLTYGLYAGHEESNAIHRIPDFSFAGYMGGGVSIPTVPTVLTISPVAGDNKANIQAAIDSVAALPLDANGHRGAVLLQAGTYEVEGSLRISSSGIVLRGEGQGTNGTILKATQATQHDFILVRGSGSDLGEVSGSRVSITSSVVPVGSTEIDIASAANFQVGDHIVVVRTPNQSWIQLVGMSQWGWTPSGYEIEHERTITAINGNTITIDIPMVDSIQIAYGGGDVFLSQVSGRIEQVGIEDLRLVSSYASSTDEDHGWTAIACTRTQNSWVQRVTTRHFGYSAVSFTAESNFNTVQEVAFLSPKSQITGSRRYSFYVGGGLGNLFQRCYADEGRHDFVSGARVTGPNVWLDCYSDQSYNDAGPHHRWATGLLFDNIRTENLHVENREDSGTGHGWSGAQVLFWNSVAASLRSDAPNGSMNWVIGTMGAQNQGQWAPNEDFGWWESHNNPQDIRSLYLKQLEARLGIEAVQNVTTASQREGRIWGQLASWAGAGLLSNYGTPLGDEQCTGGIVNGLVCCASSCGTCGGSGCGSRPGGADSCCSNPIKESGISCSTNDAPCILNPSFLSVGIE